MRILATVLTTILLSAALLEAHPGASIAVSRNGTIYIVDTGAGLFSIEPGGRTTRLEGPAFHWFAFDPDSRFVKTPWPSLPGAEFHSAGTHPTLVLSSDYPVTIGADGKFYFPDPTQGEQVRIVGIEPSGARAVRATLPKIERRGKPIRWINGLAAAADGSLFYTEDRLIRKIDRSGNVSTVVGIPSVPNCTKVPGIEEDGMEPYLRGLAIAADGTIYVAASGCSALLKVDVNHRVTPILRSSPPWSPTAVAVSGRDVFVLEYLHTPGDNRREWIPRVRKIAASGAVTVIGTGTRQ